MDNIILNDVLGENLLEKIITKSIQNFENQFITNDFYIYDNEKVSVGLKTSPLILSKHIYTSFLSFLDTNFSEIECDSNQLRNEILLAIKYKDDLKKNISRKEIFKYLNYGFTKLKFCSYYQYVQTLKKKIFSFYGENTIHHYSYLKKSRLPVQGNISCKAMDNNHAKEFLEKNRNLYWLSCSLIPELLKDGNILEDLYLKLKTMGLTYKGWLFLNSQNEHYITRFGQDIKSGIFCANFKLKDAWLRNGRVKVLVDFIYSLEENPNLIKKIYAYFGRICKSWRKPVSKFNFLNIDTIKKILFFSKKSLLDFQKSILENKKIEIDSKYFGDILKYAIKEKVEIKSTIVSVFIDKCQGDNSVKLKIPFSELEKYAKQAEVVNLKDIKQETFSLLRNNVLKEFLIEESNNNNDSFYPSSRIESKILNDVKNSSLVTSYIRDIFELIVNNIKNDFGKTFFNYIFENELVRDVYSYEIENINILNEIQKSDKIFFNDCIKLVPFSGLNYLSDVKLWFKEQGMSKSSWKRMVNYYSNCNKSIFSVFFDAIYSYSIENYMSQIYQNKKYNNYITVSKEVIYFFNHSIHFNNINIYTRYFYGLKDNQTILLNVLSEQLSLPTNLEKSSEFILNIIPQSRRKQYLRIIERGNDRGYMTEQNMAERDFHNMKDYLRGVDNKLNHKSIKSILEASNTWHENNHYNNLSYKIFEASEIDDFIIDKKYYFKQLIDTNELRKESNEMNHCVATYNDKCANGNYIVYHMNNLENNEVATLGIKRNGILYYYDQMYAEYNNFVSKEEKNAAKYLILKLNELNGNTENDEYMQKNIFIDNIPFEEEEEEENINFIF